MSHHVYYQYLTRNGADLFTCVCLPREGGQYPTVIYRSPYEDASESLSEEEACELKLQEFAEWLDAGYAVVSQHCRGRGKSSGDCVPYIYEREDGLQLQDWIRQQSFYNGELFLYGHSYRASVHFVTAPFASDIKGAILEATDSERYNCNYRNGFYKMGLHGGWYVKMYKKKGGLTKSYTPDSYRMLPLSSFSQTVFGERAEDFDEILRHPDRGDDFWNTRFGGGEGRDAIKHARIPILLVTGFYDIFTGGIFDMWREMDEETRRISALAVHPFDHGCHGEKQPINFENGTLKKAFDGYRVRWMDSIRGRGVSPFTKGKVTYYKLFDGCWCCDGFYDADEIRRVSIGEGSVTYKYNPYAPASFRGGLSANFGGNAWQDAPNSRYDIVSLYTPEFERDTFVKGRIQARLKVSSDCEDTCFYLRLSLCKEEGDYGLRDDIHQISNFDGAYQPETVLEMQFSFDEHAFVIKKGERLRVDVSSSAFPHYVPHTNQRGLFSEQTTARVATNTVDVAGSFLELPIFNDRQTGMQSVRVSAEENGSTC